MKEQFEKPLLELIGNGSVLVLCQAFAARKTCVCRHKCWLNGHEARQAGVVDATALAGRFDLAPCGRGDGLGTELGQPAAESIGGLQVVVSSRPKPRLVPRSRIEDCVTAHEILADKTPESVGQTALGQVSPVNSLLHGSGASVSFSCWGEILCILPGISVFRFLPRLAHSVRGIACKSRGSRSG